MAEMLVLNPRRKRRKARATAKRRKRTTRRKVHARRASNPVRRRRRRAVSRRRTHARRRRVHNPGIGSGGNTLMKGATIAAGAVLADVLAGKLAKAVPASWNLSTDMVRIGSKAVIAVGVPMLAKKLRVIPGNVANMIAIGGAVSVALDVINTYVKPHVPLLNDYEYGTLTDTNSPEALQSYETGMLTDTPGAYGGGGAY